MRKHPKQATDAYLLQKQQKQIEERLLEAEEREALDSSFAEIVKQLEQVFANCADVRQHACKLFGQQEALLVYVSGWLDAQLVEQCMSRLAREYETGTGKPDAMADLMERLSEAFPLCKVYRPEIVGELAKGVLSGELAIAVNGIGVALIAGLNKAPARNVEEPTSEPVIRGPREGFIESLQTNLLLVRKQIRTPRLKVEYTVIGELTQTQVAIAYVEGLAEETVVQEVRDRVLRIKTDGILGSNYIEEFIQDVWYSPFPQVHYTERPDVTAANLMEGKVAILIDGSPSVLSVPTTFWSGLQSPEDYDSSFIIGTFIRWLRYLLVIIALFLPSIYVAISTFHPEMIPTNLLISIAGAREASPFPALVEALIMEVTFEALREAGVRLPKQVGSAVSIVGALVIGEAAVQAGIVSEPMVIVVAITGIASFAIPRYNFALGLRLLRFPLIMLAGTFGLYGIGIGFLALLIHLCSLRSFGMPYFEPVAPLTFNGLKDVLIRTPHWNMNLRPQSTGKKNPLRVPPGQKPGPDRASRPEGQEGTQ